MEDPAPEPISPVTPNMPSRHSTHSDGAVQEVSEDMWDMYLAYAKVENKQLTDALIEDSNGVLAFTGLLSATVGIFIIEFYKTLSPTSGDQTVALLGKISQQLANSPNGTSPSPADQLSPPSPSASMVWANTMWLISLVFSLTSALITSLVQQWARRYSETPERIRDSQACARVHSSLSHSMRLYKVRLAVVMAPTLLHLSVYLFFGGLIIIFHTINKTVAIAIDVTVGLSVLGYIVLSIIPLIDATCLYRTPISDMLWYQRHACLFFMGLCVKWVLVQIIRCSSMGYHKHPRRSIVRLFSGLVPLTHSLDRWIRKQGQFLIFGFRMSIINSALNAPEDADRRIFHTLLFLHLQSDMSKFQKLVANMPSKAVRLMRPISSDSSEYFPFRESFIQLLRYCVAHLHASGPDKGVRNLSLSACLYAIHRVVKSDHIRDLYFVRTNFADIELMGRIWNDGDTSIRVLSRSICALIAKAVVREVVEQPELEWLHEVTGEGSSHIYEADTVTRDRMNLKPFVNGALPDHMDNLRTGDPMTFKTFKETLALLLNIDISTDSDADFDTPTFRNRLSEEVQRMQDDGSPESHEASVKLRSMFPFLPETSIPAALTLPTLIISAAPHHGDPLEQV